MKLDIVIKREHTDFVTSIAWCPDGTVLSVSDDKEVIRWTAEGEKIGKVTTLSVFPTSLAWFPASGKQPQELFAVSSTDGTLRFISKSGREEKKIAAHDGAVILLKWSHDGSALSTAGEDGDVKIWSKTGNLRSTLVSLGQSVYALAWAPDDDHLAIGHGQNLLIKSIQTNKKNLSWSAHEGLVTCVDWSLSTGLLVSGSEDCTYKVWDAFARLLYASKPMEHFVTSVAWAPSGDLFAVGSFNLVKLCDKVGWTIARERFSCGCLSSLTFSGDSTQLVAGCGSGATVFAGLVDRHFEHRNVEVTIVTPRNLQIYDHAADSVEEVEIAKERVVEAQLGGDHLVITSQTQCYLYTLGNLGTPIIFEIKAASQFIQMASPRCFLLCDPLAGISLYSFEGRFLCAPRFPNFRPELYVSDLVALSADLLAIVDCVDAKAVHLFDPISGRYFGRYLHTAEVVKIFASQLVAGGERLVALVDRSSDLFLLQVTPSTLATSSVAGLSRDRDREGNGSINHLLLQRKLRAHVESVVFHDAYNMLACISDGAFVVFYHPEVVFVCGDLLPAVTLQAQDYGRNAQLTSFSGQRVRVRKMDGSVVYTSVRQDVALLDDLVLGGRWDEAIRLCRHQRAQALWACLAALAINKKQLEAAETALAELDEVAKLEHIQSIRALPGEELRNAELLVFKKQYDDAERMLLQASPPLLYRLIKMNLNLFRFSRALELAQRYKVCLDIVCFYRKKYLQTFQREENDPKFIQAFQQSATLEEEEIRRREQQEIDEESQRYGGSSRSLRK